MVGTGRFELPTPRTPSECSTRLSHVPTRKESTDAKAFMPSTSGGVHSAILHYRPGKARPVILNEARDLSSSRPDRTAPSARKRRVPQDDGTVLIQISPVRAHTHIHLQRHSQV